MNRERQAATGDDEIATRIASYEMANRMQGSAPELMDLASESAETLALYGVKPGEASFANNCLLARRLVERGVRFVTLFHTEWDHHGGSENLEESTAKMSATRPIARPRPWCPTSSGAACLTTRWSCGGENSAARRWARIGARSGRDHHIEAYTMWLAGGGIRAGQTIGRTDELGFAAAEPQSNSTFTICKPRSCTCWGSIICG